MTIRKKAISMLYEELNHAGIPKEDLEKVIKKIVLKKPDSGDNDKLYFDIYPSDTNSEIWQKHLTLLGWDDGDEQNIFRAIDQTFYLGFPSFANEALILTLIEKLASEYPTSKLERANNSNKKSICVSLQLDKNNTLGI